jgi:hypothetical protein
MNPELRKQLDEMVDLFNQGLAIAQKLDPPQDRIIAMRTAIGGLSDPSAYANNVKPSGV